MNKYELVTIVDAQLPEQKKESINSQAVEAVTKSDGKVINSQLWLDKHKMAFSIRRCKEAAYYLTRFESVTSAVIKIRQALKINEDLLRFSIYKTEE